MALRLNYLLLHFTTSLVYVKCPKIIKEKMVSKTMPRKGQNPGAKPRSLFSGKFQTSYILYPFFGNIYADRCSIFLYKYNPQLIDMIETSINQNYLICYLCLCIKSSLENFLLEHLRRIRDASEVFWEICSDTIYDLCFMERGAGDVLCPTILFCFVLIFGFVLFCFVFVSLFVFFSISCYYFRCYFFTAAFFPNNISRFFGNQL